MSWRLKTCSRTAASRTTTRVTNRKQTGKDNALDRGCNHSVHPASYE